MDNFFIIGASVVFALLVVSNFFNAKNIRDNARLIEDLYDRLDSLHDEDNYQNDNISVVDQNTIKITPIKNVDEVTIHVQEF